MKENNPVFSLSDQAQCLRREIRMRHAVYPGRVKGEKMTQDDSDREIGLMEAAADTVEKMAKNGLFRELYGVVGAARGLSLQELHAEVERFTDQLLFAPGVANLQELALKVAGLTLRWAEMLNEQKQQPAPTANPTPAPPAQQPLSKTVTPAAAVANNAPPLEERATVAQKEEIIRLLNHPAIPRNQKTKVLLGINLMHTDKATKLIADLQAQIEQHEGPIVYRKAS